MAWHGIEGHDNVVAKLGRAMARNRLASSFLFCGPAGVGKRAFALRFAQALLCQTRPAADLDPCGTCPSCTMALAGTHPDIEVVAKPEDRATLPVRLLIGEDDTRGREGLCHWIALKPYLGGRRIAIIDDADLLAAGQGEAANCLLKTLEEPPPQSVLILIGTSPARQLPTIRSRCQLIRFLPLPEETVARLLVSRGLMDDVAEAARLARFSEGSVQQALELADAELWNCRRTLLERLSAEVLDSVGLAQFLVPFIEAAGKEASARRARLRQVVGFAADFYRSLMHLRSDLPLPSDLELRGPLEVALNRFRGDAIVAAACLDRCLETFGHIDRNANQATLIESWLNDLAAESTIIAR
jgi:DNA polymerase III subunit delta'